MAASVDNESSEERVAIFERKILRRIFGPVCENYLCWRLRYNKELYKLLDGLDVMKYIKSKDYIGPAV
jgi:hypothetical protein